MSDLAELIGRLEAAAEGSAELDARLHALLNPEQEVLFDPGDIRAKRPARRGRLADFPMRDWSDWEGIFAHVGASRYTRSIDAALTLVDGEGFWRVGHDGEGPNPGDFLAVVLPASGATQSARHSTPALALTIACLRARSA